MLTKVIKSKIMRKNKRQNYLEVKCNKTKMKKQIIIQLFLFLSVIANSQELAPEFSGIIEYKVLKNTSSADYYYSVVNKSFLYYNKGRLRIDEYINNTRVYSFFLYSDSSFYYILNSCNNKILRNTIKKDSVHTKIATKLTEKIAGLECNSLRIKNKEYSNTELWYYSTELPIYSSDIFKFSFYSNAFLYTKAPYLKVQRKSNNEIEFLEKAINITECDLSDSIFILPDVPIYNKIKHLTISEIGNELMECGEYEKAIVLYDKALWLDRTNNRARYNKAICNLKIRNNIGACKDLYVLKNLKDKQAGVLYSSLCGCKSLKPYYVKQLNKQIENKEYDQSIETFNIILSCDDGDTTAIYNRAISKFNNNQNIEAFEDIFLAKELGDKKASDFIKSADKKELSKAYFKLGEKAFREKKYKKAIKYYTIVINSFPNSVSALKGRGLSFIKLKEKEKACLDFRIAKRAGDAESEKLVKKYCKNLP